jgi:hypothetical protein
MYIYIYILSDKWILVPLCFGHTSNKGQHLLAPTL